MDKHLLEIRRLLGSFALLVTANLSMAFACCLAVDMWLTSVSPAKLELFAGLAAIGVFAGWTAAALSRKGKAHESHD